MQTPNTHAPNAFTIAPSALAFIKRMIRMSGMGASAGFRLVVSPGGCSGLQDTFTIAAGPEANDVKLDFGDVTLFVPTDCRPLLDGVVIDFVDTPTQTGLTFTDPKAQACCSDEKQLPSDDGTP